MALSASNAAADGGSDFFRFWLSVAAGLRLGKT
jgi:hypothetical protein